MSSPKFLSVDEVREIHRDAIAQFGGTLGIRDEGTLIAAVFHPQNVWHYGHGDVFEIAAAYAYHIAEAQVFLDGNKRAAIGAALTFLEGNGISTRTDSAPLYQAMIDIAEKRMVRIDLAELFRRLFQKQK